MNLGVQATELLAADGPFAGTLDWFVPRAGQIRLAREIGATIAAGEHLVAEAGTGIGKTLAYLVPILASNRRAIIATATRTLQDQLYELDLPRVAAVLGRPRTVAVLKGHDNYLCLERWRRLEGDWIGLGDAADHDDLTQWARTTISGDLAEYAGLHRDSKLRRMLAVSAEACAGMRCPEFDGCYVYRARREALAADVVIVNHHLLLADLRLRQNGAPDGLLGPADVVVVDEAHMLPDTARSMLGETLSWSQLKELYDDAANDFGGDDEVRTALTKLNESLRPVEGVLATGRHAWSEAAEALMPRLEGVGEALEKLEIALSALPDAETLAARTQGCAARLAAVTQVEGDAAGVFRWAEVGIREPFTLHASPLEPGETLAGWMHESGASWIMTSATLAVGRDFDNFEHQIGFDFPRKLFVESPFDYEHQALRYLPSDLPPVNGDDYTAAVIAAAKPLIRAATGGCFLLFTSHRALQQAAGLLRDLACSRPLFVQGEAPQARLLEGFRRAGNGILCGTASFWKGVDVKGEALQLVVIDRLPFASPGDPLFRARLRHCTDNGGDRFWDIQLPEAVLTLKQGVGRLIRDHADRGVLMICDPRLQTASYRSAFLESLPPMPVTTRTREAADFLAARPAV